MRIGIVGSGHIGGTLAELFVKAGHEVAVSNSRGPDSLADLVRRLGPAARATTVDQAAGFGDVVVVAIPFGRYRDLPADAFDGRVVVDTSNYYPRRDGRFAELDDGGTTSSELLAAHLSRARVVKAFNTIYYVRLRDEGRPGRPADERLAVPIAGDDETAKRTVAALIAEIGFAPVDVGSLADGRRQQPTRRSTTTRAAPSGPARCSCGNAAVR